MAANDYTDTANVRLLAEPLNRTDGSGGYDIADAVIAKFITQRSRYVDARLRPQFVVPFSGTVSPNTYDPSVVFCVERLACADVLAYAQGQTQKKGEPTLAASYAAEAEALLDQILAGTVDISVARTTAIPTETDSAVLPLLDEDHVPAFLADADGNDPLEVYGTT